MESVITVPVSLVMSWPQTFREQFLSRIFSSGTAVQMQQQPDNVEEASEAPRDPHFRELDPTQARSFIAGCGDKVKRALTVIVSGNSRYFQLAAVAQELKEDPSKLGGVWGGITRRLKTVTQDSDAYLIDWEKSSPVFDTKGNYVDHKAELTEGSYRSLRQALGLN